jgi:hypothetical protein
VVEIHSYNTAAQTGRQDQKSKYSFIHADFLCHNVVLSAAEFAV